MLRSTARGYYDQFDQLPNRLPRDNPEALLENNLQRNFLWLCYRDGNNTHARSRDHAIMRLKICRK